jgi:hypothetical protein
MSHVSRPNCTQPTADGLQDIFATAALESGKAWVDALMTAMLYGTSYSISAAMLMGADFSFLCPRMARPHTMLFDVGASTTPGELQRRPNIDATRAKDLADHLGESRMPIPCAFVLAYSVVR